MPVGGKSGSEPDRLRVRNETRRHRSRQTEAEKTARPRRARHHHNVYVVELDGAVVDHARFRALPEGQP
jgi:hypothetical protein